MLRCTPKRFSRQPRQRKILLKSTPVNASEILVVVISTYPENPIRKLFAYRSFNLVHWIGGPCQAWNPRFLGDRNTFKKALVLDKCPIPPALKLLGIWSWDFIRDHSRNTSTIGQRCHFINTECFWPSIRVESEINQTKKWPVRGYMRGAS